MKLPYERHPPETIKAVIKLVFERGFSYGEASKELEITRNVVAGIVHRHRKEPQHSTKKPIQKPARKRTPPHKKSKPRINPNAKPATIYDINGNQCRYITNTTHPATMCGAPTHTDKSPWCAFHAKICVTQMISFRPARYWYSGY